MVGSLARMKRKTRIFLTFSALGGVAATVFLMVSLLSGDSFERRGHSGASAFSRDSGDSRRRGGKVSVQRVGDGPSSRSRNGKGYGSLTRPGQREAFDSPETDALRARQSARILSILDTIRSDDSSNPTKSQKLFLEMQKLVRSLGHRLPRTTRDELVDMIDSVEPQWRRLIGATLGNLQGDAETAQILMSKLEGKPKDIHTRRALLLAITNIESDAVLPSLTNMLGNNYEDESLVARAIGRIGGQKATDALLSYLERDLVIGSTAREIERILGSSADPAALEKVAKSLESANPRKRASMLNVLGASKKDGVEHSAAIRKLLKQEMEPSVRAAAIRALGQIGDVESGQQLLELAQGGDPRQSSQAINAIHTIRDAKTVAKLAEDWSRLSDSARFAVIGAAARLPRPNEQLVGIARESINDSNIRVRTAAVRVLGASRSEKHVDLLGSVLRGSKTASERSAALEALRRIGTEKAAEEVLRNVHSLPQRQQQSVRVQFERIRDKRAKMRSAGERRR